MKLVNFLHQGKASYGVLKNERVIDLSSRLKQATIEEFIADGSLAEASAVVEKNDGDFKFDSLRLLPVVARPGKIFCIAINYVDHMEEANRVVGGPVRTKKPWPSVFMRVTESLTAHGQPIIKPKVSEQLDYEAELLAVIGKPTGRYVDESRALEHVFGYSIMNEGSVRDYNFHNSQITPGKNFSNTGPIGPWIVTADEIPDPQSLNIEMRLNGEIMQKANTRDMVHSVAKIIAYLTHWTELKPGDLIATGTMGGVGLGRTPQVWMKAGDVAEIEIERIGTLRNVIENEAP